MDISKITSDHTSICKDPATEETLELQEKNKIPDPVRVNEEPKGLPPKVMLKLLNDKSEYIYIIVLIGMKKSIRMEHDHWKMVNCYHGMT